MPCLFAFLAISFPRVAIVLLWLFTNFFAHLFHDIIIPVLGFLFLPLTLLVYAYLLNTHTAISDIQLVFLFIAAILDLGLIGGGTGVVAVSIEAGRQNRLRIERWRPH